MKETTRGWDDTEEVEAERTQKGNNFIPQFLDLPTIFNRIESKV